MLFIPTFITISLILVTVIYIYPEHIPDFKVPNIVETRKVPTKDEVSDIRYRIPIGDEVSNVEWYSKDNLIYQTNRDIMLFNIKEREETRLMRINSDENVMFGKEGSSILCTWENRVKEKPDDIGSVVRVFSGEKEVKRFEIVQTIKVDDCSIEKILASNAFDFMETASYTFDCNTEKVVKEEKIKEIINPIVWKQNNGKLTVTKDSKPILSTPFIEEIESIRVSNDGSNFLVETRTGYWIISKQ